MTLAMEIMTVAEGVIAMKKMYCNKEKNDKWEYLKK